MNDLQNTREKRDAKEKANKKGGDEKEAANKVQKEQERKKR